MSTARIIALFILGLFLSLFTAAFGYLGLIPLLIGLLLIVKSGNRLLPVILGSIIIAFTLLMMMAYFSNITEMKKGEGVESLTNINQSTMEITSINKTSTVMANKTLIETMKTNQTAEKFAENKTIAKTWQPVTVTVEDWEITVLGVKEAKYIKCKDDYYAAYEGQKVIIVSLRIKNNGKEIRSTGNIYSFILVTNANKSYEEVSYCGHFKYLPKWTVYDEVVSSAIHVTKLKSQELAPGTYTEGDLLFEVSQNETPAKLFFKVWVWGFKIRIVEVDLRKVMP